MEAAHDRANGWVDFTPVQGKSVPSFLTPSTVLPENFPGREWLDLAGFTTMESIADKTLAELQEIRGIGAATAQRILDAQ